MAEKGKEKQTSSLVETNEEEEEDTSSLVRGVQDLTLTQDPDSMQDPHFPPNPVMDAALAERLQEAQMMAASVMPVFYPAPRALSARSARSTASRGYLTSSSSEESSSSIGSRVQSATRRTTGNRATETDATVFSVELPRSLEIDDAIRKEWATLGRDDYNQAVKLVKRVWDTISANNSSFYSLFHSNVVEKIIRRVTCNVIDYRSAGSTSGNGANLLITGVRGVGKTTLMRGLWTVLSALQGPKLIAIYHDYETGSSATLTELIFKHFEEKQIAMPPTITSDGSSGADFRTLLQRLWEADYRVAMFLDEIQTLFVPRDSDDYNRFLGIAREILALGKSEYDCFGVLSGSTSDVRYLAYHLDPIAIEGNYPNLNHNVYREYPLDPVRNRDELAGIMGKAFSPQQVDECFKATGGVGRSVKIWMSDPLSYATADQDFISELNVNDAFFAVVACLAKSGHPADAWQLGLLEQTDLNDIIIPRLASPDHAHGTVLRWLDRGFLYKSPDHRYEILVPSRLDLFRSLVADPAAGRRDGITAALKAAVLGTIGGWDSESSAGHLIESYICRRLTLGDIEPAMEFWDQLTEYPPSDYVRGVRLNELVAARKAEGPLLSLKQDFGVDGVLICPDPEVDGSYHLHTIQVKAGRRDVSITEGGPASERPVADNRDRVMRGIIYNAKRGIADILTSLGDSYPITKITFTLFTTKKVVPKAMRCLARGFQVALPDDPAARPVACLLQDQTRTLALFQPRLLRLLGALEEFMQ